MHVCMHAPETKHHRAHHASVPAALGPVLKRPQQRRYVRVAARLRVGGRLARPCAEGGEVPRLHQLRVGVGSRVMRRAVRRTASCEG